MRATSPTSVAQTTYSSRRTTKCHRLSWKACSSYIPAVVEAAVVPQPDETRLCVPKAYIALAEGWRPNAETARQIMEYARDHLKPYLKVRRVEFYELPKTISGKIRRVELRQREEDAYAAGIPIVTEHRDEDLLMQVKRPEQSSTDCDNLLS